MSNFSREKKRFFSKDICLVLSSDNQANVLVLLIVGIIAICLQTS